MKLLCNNCEEMAHGGVHPLFTPRHAPRTHKTTTTHGGRKAYFGKLLRIFSKLCECTYLCTFLGICEINSLGFHFSRVTNDELCVWEVN